MKNDDLLGNFNLDKGEEYLKLKGVIKTLSSDIKDIKDSLEAQIELDKINKKVKELREKIKGDDTIHELNEKLGATRERLELIKELIRIDLIENSQDELVLEKDGARLKLKHVIKEIKKKEHLAQTNLFNT